MADDMLNRDFVNNYLGITESYKMPARMMEILFTIIERAYPRFKAKYMTTINMQFGQLKFLMVDYHPDRQAQEYVAGMVRQVHALEKQEQKIIEELKEQKRFYLGTMFV